MEVSGLVSHQILYLSGASIDTWSSKPLLSGNVHFSGRNEFGVSLRTRRAMDSGFCDNGHVKYYDSALRCVGIKMKKEITKKLKLLKTLAELSSPSQIISTGWDSEEGLAAQVQGKLISV